MTTAIDTNLGTELDAIALSTDLHALTEIVRRGRRTAWEVTAALWRIREAKLYKSTHSSWESWLQDNWWGSKRHVDRQIAALRVWREMGPQGPSELGERHIRELSRVAPGEIPAVLAEVGDGASASEIRQAIERRAAEVQPAPAGQLGFGIPGAPRRDLSQWDTRPDTAKWFVEWAGVHGAKPPPRILEPSAGKGHIVRALLAGGATVTAVEIDPARADDLQGASPHHVVHCADFLEWAAALGPGDHFDAAVMNPPYERDQDLAHVLAALSVAPVVFVIARLVLLEGQERRKQLWSQHTLKRLCVFSARESFEGDVDGTARSAFAAFEIQRGPGRSTVEWR